MASAAAVNALIRDDQLSISSFRGCAKRRTRNLLSSDQQQIPDHGFAASGMTSFAGRHRRVRND
jgi:hypothetical protein